MRQMLNIVCLRSSVCSRFNRRCSQANGRLAPTSHVVRHFAIESLEDRAFLSAQGLDANFGNAGLVPTPFSGPISRANAMAFENDGKLVVVGANERLESNPGWPPSLTIYGGDALVRYNADGSLDTTFGNDGKIETPLLQGKLGAQSVAIQTDGKILLIGSNGLTRYNADGSIDTRFGINGVVASPGGSQMALQGDKIIVCGGGLHRYNADGSLDTTFGDQGVVPGQGPGEVVIDPQGRIVVANYNKILRYNSDGSPDTSFGNGGQLTVPGSPSSGLVALAPDGKIDWAGGVADTTVKGFQVVRYRSDGSLDTSFGNGGIDFIAASTDIPEFPNSILVQSDGKIVAAGGAGTFSIGMEDEPTRFTGAVFTARLNADGSLDSTWGSGGKAEIVMGGNRQAFAVAETPNGQIAIAGTDFFVAQFAPSFNQSLVEHGYLDLLGRAADLGGLDYFTGLLDRQQINREEFVTILQMSAEHRRLAVEQAYHDFLQRTPDPGGLQLWSDFLAAGGDEEQLSANIIGSDEYFNRISGDSEAVFLDHLFMDVLKRPIDPGAAQWFSTALANGESRSEVADEVLRSPENNNLVVTSSYQAFLGRTPDTTGLAFFTNALAAHATWEQVAAALSSSEEYFSGM